MKKKSRSSKKISGLKERPRLSIFRSSKHIYLQVINDQEGKTLVSASSFEKNNRIPFNIEGCFLIGKKLGERCLEKNIDKILFCKGSYKYHGKVKAVAEGAREAGLNF